MGNCVISDWTITAPLITYTIFYDPVVTLSSSNLVSFEAISTIKIKIWTNN